MYKKLKNPPPLERVKTKIKGADKGALSVAGRIYVNISTPRQTFRHPVYVINNLHPDAIIGSDFMRKAHCTMVIHEDKVIIGKEELKDDVISVLRLHAGITMKPFSECIVATKPDQVLEQYLQINCLDSVQSLIVEPANDLAYTKGVITCPTVTRLHCINCAKFPVRLYNLNPYRVHLPPGTEVGFLAEIEALAPTEFKEKKTWYKKGDKKPKENPDLVSEHPPPAVRALVDDLAEDTLEQTLQVSSALAEEGGP